VKRSYRTTFSLVVEVDGNTEHESACAAMNLCLLVLDKAVQSMPSTKMSACIESLEEVDADPTNRKALR
jgi:hypothetical protein